MPAPQAPVQQPAVQPQTPVQQPAVYNQLPVQQPVMQPQARCNNQLCGSASSS